MKQIIVFIFSLLFTYIKSNGQTYLLPNDPLKTYQQNLPPNWLKNSAEEALDKTNEINDEIIPYFQNYFFDYIDVLKNTAKNPSLVKKTYNWARPYIRSKILSFSLHDKIILRNQLLAGIHYLKTVDLKKELKYFQESEADFALLYYSDHFNNDLNRPYPIALREYEASRQVEAFLFRRIKEGFNQDFLFQTMQELLSFIKVDVKSYVRETDKDGNLRAEYLWDKTQIEGTYKRYGLEVIKGRNQAFINVLGNYFNGKKNGIWAFYRMEWRTGERKLDYEITYLDDVPQSFKNYYSEDMKDNLGNIQTYSINDILNFKNAQLDVKVFRNDKFLKSYNSTDDEISISDLYETNRRILDNLRNPKDESSDLTRNYNSKAKDQANRNLKTGNTFLYDELQRTGKDHALIIATDTYDDLSFQKLKNPVRDANSISDCLKNQYGFECEILANPTKAEILRTLTKYQNQKFSQDEQLLIYITGHGSFKLNEGYIVPKDGKNPVKDLNRTSWLSYTELTNIINNLQCKHILLMLDACYSGAIGMPLAAMKEVPDPVEDLQTLRNWFMRKMKLTTKRIIASSASDRESSDGINHSPFCKQFLNALTTILDKSFTVTYEEILGFFSKSDGDNIFIDEFPQNSNGSTFIFVLK